MSTPFLDRLLATEQQRRQTQAAAGKAAVDAAIRQAAERMHATIDTVLQPGIRSHFDLELDYTPDRFSPDRPLPTVDWYLWPRDLPEYASHLGLYAQLHTVPPAPPKGQAAPASELRLSLAVRGSGNPSAKLDPYKVVTSAQSADQQLTAIAQILSGPLAEARDRHEYDLRQAEKERKQQEAAVQARARQIELDRLRKAAEAEATAELDRLVAEARARLEAERAAFAAANAWPEGREVRLWLVAWYAAYDSQSGEAHGIEHYAFHPAATSVGNVSFVDARTGQRVDLWTPNGYTVTSTTLRRLAELPYGLRSGLQGRKLYAARVEVTRPWSEQHNPIAIGENVELAPVDYPLGALRPFLGLPPMEED